MTESKDKTTKFCILSTQRSGSTWLTELLNNDPQVVTLGELFLWRNKTNKLSTIVPKDYQNQYSSTQTMKISTPTFCDFATSKSGVRPWIIFKYLEQFDVYSEKYSAVGFKLMYNQLLLRPEILVKFAIDGYKIIHLVRKNYLDILISKASMKQHGYVHLKSNIDTLPVTLEISSLLQKLSFREFVSITIQKLLNILPNSVLEISYESLCSDKTKAMSHITDFLEIPSKEIEYISSLKKINSGSYHKKITNYEQVKEILEGTRFQNLLI